MNTGAWLHQRLQEITPSPEEERAVIWAQDAVSAALQGDYRIAERRPSGSARKGTMLKGRKEGDQVLFLREAPTPQTLTDWETGLRQVDGVCDVKPHHKAIEVCFANGVRIDVLPAAVHGLTEPGGSVPRKHRHAADGPSHVAWFGEHGQRTAAHGVVRLTKHFRDEHGLALCSFGIEILTVEVLRALGGGTLEERFSAVLERLRRGEIAVNDPVRSSNWINQLDASALAQVQRSAERSLEALRSGRPSVAFPSRGPVLGSLAGLSGTPLA